MALQIVSILTSENGVDAYITVRNEKKVEILGIETVQRSKEYGVLTIPVKAVDKFKEGTELPGYKLSPFANVDTSRDSFKREIVKL